MNNCSETHERLWDRWLLESIEFYEFNESEADNSQVEQTVLWLNAA